MHMSRHLHLPHKAIILEALIARGNGMNTNFQRKSKSGVSTAAFVDHRFVTEEEMRDFINNHKNDVDLSSVNLDAQAFKDLPIETQHDIVTELKNRSRQADHRRLAGLVNAAPNPMAFSALQIKHLVKRNDLTERLQNLAKNAGVTSNPGLKKWKAKNARRPQRVASERAREYMLVKNADTGGHTIKLNAQLERGGAGGFQNEPSIAPTVINLVDEDGEVSEETSGEEIEPDVDARMASVRRLPAKKQLKRITAKQHHTITAEHHHTTPATEVDSDDDEEFEEITDIPTPPYTASAVSGMEQDTNVDMTSHEKDQDKSLLANFQAYLPDNLPIEKIMEYFATGPPEGPTEDGPSTDMYEDVPPQPGWGGHRSSPVPAWPDSGFQPESYVGRREVATEGGWDAQPAMDPGWTGENTWEENKSNAWGKDVALGWSTEVEKEVTTLQLEEKHSWTKSGNDDEQEGAFVVEDEARQLRVEDENVDGWARSPLRNTPDPLEDGQPGDASDIPTPPYTASAVSGMEQDTNVDMTSHEKDQDKSLLANFQAYLPDNLPIEKIMEYFATGPPEGPTEDGPSTDMYEDVPPQPGWGGHRSSPVPAWPDSGFQPESYVGRREVATEGGWDAQPAMDPGWTGENTWEENKSNAWGKDVALGWSTEVEKEVTTLQLEEKHSWTKSGNDDEQEGAFVVEDEARQLRVEDENVDGWARSPLRNTPDPLEDGQVTYPETSVEEQKLLTYGELEMNEAAQHRDASNTRLNDAVLKVLTGAITPDEAYNAWQDILSDAFTSVYPDHENMLRLAVYGWSEEEVQEELTHVKKRHDKAVEGSISAQAHELWTKILEYTLIWREERSSKNETVTVAPAEAAGSDHLSPIAEKSVIVADPDHPRPDDRASTTDIQVPIDFSKLLPPRSPEPIITDRIGFLARTSPMKRTLTSNVANVIQSPKRSSADVLGFASDSEDEEFHSPAIKKHKRPDIVEGIMEAEVEMTEVTSGLLAATKEADGTAPVTPPHTKPIVEHVNTPPSEEEPSRVSAYSTTPTETASVNPAIQPGPTAAQATIDLNDGSDLFEDDVYLNNEDEEVGIDVPTELNEENEEYTRFVSSLSNQTPDDVARRLESEMISLNKQKRKEEASAVDIETQLIREIQELLRIFGLPYIAAPMEAESQCAWLVQNSLVDGIVTDDSDVFLFGGTMIYKNMFNQQKYVEEYTMDRLEETMLLTREKLVQLAYLLGSDYTEGIEGIGPTSAMEILTMWRGEGLEPLQGFREWWERVLRGETDVDEEPILRRLRKHCQKLAIPSSFPDPRVLDAYFHPQLDTNPTAFTWGRPDLNALRDFMEDKLDWKQHQVDHIMIPLIKEMDRNLNAKNRQARLDKFFSVTSTNVHASERVREVVEGWKEGGGKRRKVESKRGKKTVSKRGRGRGRK
ncbi:DNA excision repair protein (rad2) [Spizellomyces punctatus DAOM BR117]|uniref:DNA excision repair protein (Rad2) n=1 Tax=Spizellomyces punctatus (strain DAOM BR117) TaxID=645134 RepID=A0A0L0HTE6_SPIPD|nr:DNA excision repair protein (rad2) [Spizellomyces punctatus DAOM BR117]KND04377.1 DNA excision repair protein (rad2) [Spizellomyces punctatus DAOM BR117]|eukprot:XP_016612416.1 DNA excision repair protein (rad2) [Spizellomyces punctatus DAOM BR117]